MTRQSLVVALAVAMLTAGCAPTAGDAAGLPPAGPVVPVTPPAASPSPVGPGEGPSASTVSSALTTTSPDPQPDVAAAPAPDTGDSTSPGADPPVPPGAPAAAADPGPRGAGPGDASSPPQPSPTVEGAAASILPVSVDDLGASWRPGCPVPVDQLRLLEVPHLGFDGDVHRGHLVVHADWADRLAGVFARLLAAGFPIERMETIDAYDGSDSASMAADNTSAFNCRPVSGTDRWSEHAYGRAVDINPLVNPYVAGGLVDPPGGAVFLDRDPSVPGLVVDGDVVVEIFAGIGWGWGGHWSTAKDYQHFSATGR